jgi:hypothetical protein
MTSTYNDIFIYFMNPKEKMCSNMRHRSLPGVGGGTGWGQMGCCSGANLRGRRCAGGSPGEGRATAGTRPPTGCALRHPAGRGTAGGTVGPPPCPAPRTHPPAMQWVKALQNGMLTDEVVCKLNSSYRSTKYQEKQPPGTIFFLGYPKKPLKKTPTNFDPNFFRWN